MISNYMETIVANTLEDELKSNPQKYTDVCRCPECMAIAKCVALNNLPPFYVTSLAGEVFGEYGLKEQQNRSDVLVAIGRGLDELQRLAPHSTPGAG